MVVSNNSANGLISGSYTSVSGNYSVGANDYFVLCTANSFNVTLPTAVGRQNKIYQVKNSGFGTITILTTGGQTIDGQTSQQLIQSECLTLQSNNANWFVI